MSDLDIFLNAPDETTAGELRAYLDEACGSDTELRKRVESLFAADGRTPEFMGQALPEIALPAEFDALPTDAPGSMIGNYKLLQKIGEGGFGEVYMAEQLAPVRRKVAFKIIKLGMDTKQVVARFEVERQALALMDHPNIAKVHDAGSTDAGRPFFVMELVKGIPLTKFCDETKLDTNQRLKLFIDVCHAVQHAHQKGVIHRDLKPSNVMITQHDDKAVPKVIDFGVAKATQTDLTDLTLYTRYEQLIGTPAYMSPEQAQMSGLDIDTRSDIYSLGVLLYELLTGTTPFDSKELAKAGQDEVRRIIREDEPPKPSTRSRSTLHTNHTPPSYYSNPSSLRGDLDWIVMKALEKDRTRRYDTATGLAMDIERHLADEPVVAGPPGVSYRIGKTLQRHRVAVLTAAAMMVLLISGGTTSTWQWLHARSNAIVAEGAKIEAIDSRKRAENERRIAKHRVAEELFSSGKISHAIAHLAKLLREDDTNTIAAERLMSAIWHRQFTKSEVKPVPVGGGSGEFSHDGVLFVTASKDRDGFQVYDSMTGQPQGRKLKLPGMTQVRATFGPKGNQDVLLTRSNSRLTKSTIVQMWNWRTGESIGEPVRHEALVGFAEISPDGHLFASGDEYPRIVVGETRTGKVIIEPKIHDRLILCGDFSPDSQRIVTGSGGGAQVWVARTGKKIGRRLEHALAVNVVKFDPTGERIITGSNDGTAQIWDARTGAPIGQPLIHQDRVVSVDFAPDGMLSLTGSWDSTAHLWDSDTGEPFGEPVRHEHPVTSAQFDTSGRRFFTVTAKKTQVWDTGTQSPFGAGIGRDELERVSKLSPTGERLMTLEKYAEFWPLRPGQPRSQILRHRHGGGWTFFPRAVHSANFSSDGELLITAGTDGSACVWDVRSGRRLRRYEQRGKVGWASFNADRSLALSASTNEGVRIWDPATGELQSVILENRVVWLAKFCPVEDAQGRWRVATPSLGQTDAVQIWDARKGEQIGPPLTLGGDRSLMSWVLKNGIEFSQDGKLIAGVSGKTAHIWNIEGDPDQWRQLSVLPGHLDRVWGITFSPNGERAVTASTDNTARVWDVASGRPLFDPLKHSGVVPSAQFSPDGKTIVTTSGDKTARLWDANTGEPRGSSMKHDRIVSGADFSSDSKRVVTASLDGTARLWNAETGLPLSEPLLHNGPIFHVKFSPDGQKVVTAADDSTARLWDVPPAPSGPAPKALARWAEAVVGLRLDDSGASQKLNWEEREQRLKEALTNMKDDAFYGRTVEWFYEDMESRTISPFSEIKLPAYVDNRMREIDINGHHEKESLEEVLRVAPNHGASYPKLAEILLNTEMGDKIANLRRARYYARHSTKLESDNPEHHDLLDQIEEKLAAAEATARLAQVEAHAEEAMQRGDRSTARALMAAVTIDRVLLATEFGWPNEVQRAEAMRSWNEFINDEHPPIVLLERGAEWKYLDAQNPLPPGDWIDPDFDDSQWHAGQGILGFKDNQTTTLKKVDTPDDTRITFYFRTRFGVDDRKNTLTDLNQRSLVLRLLRDDGAVVYLNGKEILRSNMPAGDVDANTFAANTVGGSEETRFHHFYLHPELLQQGNNVLAVEIHQINPGSSDISFDLELEMAKHSGKELAEVAMGQKSRRFLFAPDESLTEQELGAASESDLEMRVRVQWLLEEYAGVIESIDAVIAALPITFSPVDVHQRKEWLRRKADALEAINRAAEATAVLEQVTAVPIRDPDIDPRLIDLSEQYTESFFESAEPTAQNQHYWYERLAESYDPDGGPNFDLRGKIQLNSGIYPEGTGAIAGKDYNMHTSSSCRNDVRIAIDQKTKAIHFLQSCRYGREPVGEEVAHYIVHFEDGEPVREPVIYGKDIVDNWIHSLRPEELEGIEKFAWKQPFSGGTWAGILALTQQTWENPHPDKTITHVDFVSAGKRAAPFLVAITLE